MMLRHILANGRGAGLRRILSSASSNRFLHTPTLERYAIKKISRKTLNTLIPTALSETTLLDSANYVREELPIHLAHRIIEMKQLPYFVLSTESLFRVYEVYENAFTSFTRFPTISTLDEEGNFYELLTRIVAEGAMIIELTAVGLAEAQRVAKRLGAEEGLETRLQDWVDILMASRIGRRVLAEQHIALHGAVRNGIGTSRQKYGGVVELECDVIACLDRAILAASDLSTLRYGAAPDVKISGSEEARLPFVRAHLDYMVFELLKNSMRATVEHARRDGDVQADLPEVQVFLAKGPTELTIRISDAGGGMKKGELDKAFIYGFSTAEDEAGAVADDDGSNVLGNVLSRKGEERHGSVMAGLGFGLPMTRLYARYFGGDVKLVNLEGYGCDVYLTLSRTGDVLENIEV